MNDFYVQTGGVPELVDLAKKHATKLGYKWQGCVHYEYMCFYCYDVFTSSSEGNGERVSMADFLKMEKPVDIVDYSEWVGKRVKSLQTKNVELITGVYKHVNYHLAQVGNQKYYTYDFNNHFEFMD